jgi:hypothetical protein
MYQTVAASVCMVPHEKGDDAHLYTSVKRNRGIHRDKTHSLEIKVQLADCLPLEVNGKVSLRLGVVEGYFLSLDVTKEAGDDGGAPTVGLFVELVCPDTRGLDGGELDTVGLSGPVAVVRVAMAGEIWSSTILFPYKSAYGIPDWFGKPLDEVVYEGSQYFKGDCLVLTVDARLIADKHMPCVPEI